MSTLLDEPVFRPSTSPSQRLQTTMAAVQISLSWLQTRSTSSRPGRRSCLCMGVPGKAGVIKPNKDAVRIESSDASQQPSADSKPRIIRI